MKKVSPQCYVKKYRVLSSCDSNPLKLVVEVKKA